MGADVQSGLVHTVQGTAAIVNEVVESISLLRGSEIDDFADAGWQGAAKRPDAISHPRCYRAMRPGRQRAPNKTREVGRPTDKLERIKARIRAKVEHPFRVIKRRIEHIKVRYRRLAKNTVQLKTRIALANLCMACRSLLVRDGQVRPNLQAAT
jgi:IS5 family transposase